MCCFQDSGRIQHCQDPYKVVLEQLCLEIRQWGNAQVCAIVSPDMISMCEFVSSELAASVHRASGGIVVLRCVTESFVKTGCIVAFKTLGRMHPQLQGINL